MSEVTELLAAIDQGQPQAADRLLPLVYDELRRLAAARLAAERPGQTLQATALVHEAYLRLVGSTGSAEPESQIDVDSDGRSRQAGGTYASRGHFFGAAAEAMRRILIENARSKGSQKRGGDWRRVDFESLELTSSVSPDQLLALDEVLERLSGQDPVAGSLVKLRYFAGLGLDQAAVVLDISLATAYRHWAYARAWLRCELLGDNSQES